MYLNGIHHVTAVTAKINENHAFFTRVLGLRLVKRSVNQDDVSAYHLFYADKVGSPGTDMTFFDWANIGKERRGTDSITATAFRVAGSAALEYWQERLSGLGVTHQGIEHFAGRAVLRFEDSEGQRMLLVDDHGAPYEGEIWDGAGIPAAYAIRGFYAVMLSIPNLEYIAPILTQVLGYQEMQTSLYPDGRQVVIYSTGTGGAGRELWVMEEPAERPARLGSGGVHHVAFRVATFEEQQQWHKRITSTGIPASSFVDRFWFRSIYFRISNGILFEIATDGPGFAVDEDAEHLGETLVLPPFLEPHRQQIEAGLTPLNL
jgi:glyoxalase family protein